MNLKQHATDARRLLAGFRAFEEVAKALDVAVGLEQHIAELNEAITKLSQDRDIAAAALEAAERKVASANANAAQIAAEAQAQAKKVVEDAIDQGARIVRESKEREQQHVDRARQELVAMQAQEAEALAKRDAALAVAEDLDRRATAVCRGHKCAPHSLAYSTPRAQHRAQSPRTSRRAIPIPNTHRTPWSIFTPHRAHPTPGTSARALLGLRVFALAAEVVGVRAEGRRHPARAQVAVAGVRAPSCPSPCRRQS